MSGRGGLATFFLFLFLSITILLQVLSIVQSDRLYERINHLNQTLEKAGRVPAVQVTPAVPGGVAADEEYPGDDGDWLIWAFRVDPKTLNPISAETDIYTVWITIPYIFEPLLVYDYDPANGRQLKPHLAESYEVSSDGLEITFRLREDIHFSDGMPLTADDVIFTYETITNPKIDAANVASRYADVLKVTKIDNLVVKFSLKRPHFRSLENLSFIRTGILPKHIYGLALPLGAGATPGASAGVNHDRFNKRVSNPVGSGPYVFEKWDVGRQVVLRRNENYWGKKPKLRKVVYRFIANPVAIAQALRSHQVDIVIPEPEQFAELAEDGKFSKEFYCLSYWTPSTPFYYIGWNQGTPFFSDRLVRLAMTHIINREEIIAHLLQGRGRQITGPFYSLGPENDPNIEPIAYDPQTGGQLLDKAGWRDTDGDGLRDKDGVPLRFKFMYASSYALFERLAKLLKDEAAKVGVEVIAEPCEWSILWDRLNRREFQAYIAGWAGDAVEDPYQLFHSSQIGGGGSNFVGFRNSEADVIIEQAGRTIIDAERHRLYQRLHGILHEEQPYTFLFTRPTFRLVDRRFKNVVVHKLGLDYLQWYVPKSEQRYE